jgi:hypothetical protein
VAEAFNGNPIIWHNGTMILEQSLVSHTTCEIEMSQFPFDQQKCKLLFSSWAYSNETFNLTFIDDDAGINTVVFVNNSEWDLVATSASRNLEIATWHDLTFYIEISRRPGFYVYVLIIPSLLLSFLTPLLFTIPPSRPDRTTLGSWIL